MNRDNQQATLKEGEIGWLAGIIEGEGSICLSVYSRKTEQNPKVGIQVKVYNTDAGIIRKAVKVLKKMEIKHHLNEREMKPMLRPGGGEYKPSAPMLTLTVSKLGPAKELLEQLLPWLFGDKRHRAILIIDYLESRLNRIDQNGGNFRNIGLNTGEVSLITQYYNMIGKQCPL